MTTGDKEQPGGQGGNEGGDGGNGDKAPAGNPPRRGPAINPDPPRSDPGGTSHRWEVPKPWKRDRSDP